MIIPFPIARIKDPITPFKLYRYTLDYKPPFSKRSGLLLRIFDYHAPGWGKTQRWGEIAPLPGRSQETLAEAEEQILAIMRGEKPQYVYPSIHFALYCVQNPPPPTSIPLSALLAGTPEQIIIKAREAVTQGYTSAKIKISGMLFETAVDLIEQLRPLFRLRVDANRAFSFKDAMKLCEKCGAHGLDYIEEPTYELDRLEEFCYPFALDESLLEMKTLPVNPYFKALIWKPSVMHRDAILPLATNKEVILSSACESGIGMLGLASYAATLKKVHPVGLDTYRFLNDDVLYSKHDFSKGHFLPVTMYVNLNQLKEIAYG